MVTSTGKRVGASLGAGLAGLGLLTVGFAGPASAKPAWTSGTFVYADLCTRSDDGTRVGQRIVLRRSPNGDGLTYEGAEGTAPLAATMSLDDATRALSFAVETEAGALRFAGSATPEALDGTLEDEAGAHPVHLPRVLRSHAHEACPEDVTGSLRRKR